MLNDEKIIMTSFFYNGTLIQFFEFCQLWRSILDQNFIFIKKNRLLC